MMVENDNVEETIVYYSIAAVAFSASAGVTVKIFRKAAKAAVSFNKKQIRRFFYNL